MINGSKVIICDKSPADAANDYTWQTDPELAHLTATHPPTTNFADYLSKYNRQLRYRQPGKLYFSIKTRGGKHIGNCTCCSLNTTKGEAEIGIVIGDRHYRDKGYGSDAVSRLVDYIFSRNQVMRIHLKTLASNKRAQRCFSKCGFKVCGQVVIGSNNYILMELHYSQWPPNNNAQ
jgi:RimJ/RimL family protein N-acetyltransferase